jgi:hypothetical protein
LYLLQIKLIFKFFSILPQFLLPMYRVGGIDCLSFPK